jgi:hypothetical protein
VLIRSLFLSFFLPFFLSCRYLRDNFFTGNIPEELGNLTQLTRLWVAKLPGLVMVFFCTCFDCFSNMTTVSSDSQFRQIFSFPFFW